VHVDPEMFPPAPIPESYRARLRCSKCGGRGADILIGWATPSSAGTGSGVGNRDTAASRKIESR